MQTPLPESSSRAPGAGVGDCKTYSVAYNAAGVLNILEAMPMRALFFERTDDTLNHAVLLRAARRDEHLAQLAKGTIGDAIHAVLCAAGHNIRLPLR